MLADTHALVWAVNSPEMLSPAALAAFQDEEILTSVASLWELSVKSAKKNALVSDPVAWWRKHVINQGVATLPIRVADVIELSALTDIHKDPFDRILVAQALAECTPLITKDKELGRHGIPTIW